MKKPLILIILGKSGSGKGTQADLLIKKFKLEHVSSGDLLRARAKRADFIGKKTKKILNTGGLVPLSAIFNLWFQRLEYLKNKKNINGIVLDGMPRKLFEANLLDDALGWFEWGKNVKAFLVDISNKEAIRRLTTRRLCKDCKEIIPFVGKFKEMTKCPKCGGELEKRTDDNVAAAKNRLAWFKTDVQPVINYYRKTGRLIKINGEQSIEDVFKDVLKFIK
ncbi:MAG: nucleoside monophosphate kinase [Candidatus Pacebacteria bacterium]|nr:nucleoside monophosphate kinase [Candidatus Paceibacterota bacterium]